MPGLMLNGDGDGPMCSEVAGGNWEAAHPEWTGNQGTCRFMTANEEKMVRNAMCSSPAAAAQTTACELFPADCTTVTPTNDDPVGTMCAPTGTNFNTMMNGVLTTLTGGGVDHAPPELVNGDDWNYPCAKEALAAFIKCECNGCPPPPPP